MLSVKLREYGNMKHPWLEVIDLKNQFTKNTVQSNLSIKVNQGIKQTWPL